MSTTEEFAGGRSSGGRSRAAQTCNRLSRFLKESGSSLGGLGLDLTGKNEFKGTFLASHPLAESKYDLFSENVKNSTGELAKNGLMDLFPRHSMLEDASHDGLSRKEATEETRGPQMTIIYGGKLFVFDNFPAEKVEYLVALARGDTCPVSLPKPQLKPVASDLPIMRSASLQRFMDRRKDRAIARAPYQVHGSPPAPSTKHEEQLTLKL